MWDYRAKDPHQLVTFISRIPMRPAESGPQSSTWELSRMIRPEKGLLADYRCHHSQGWGLTLSMFTNTQAPPEQAWTGVNTGL